MEHVWDVSHCRRCGASLMSVQMGSEPDRCGAPPPLIAIQPDPWDPRTYARPGAGMTVSGVFVGGE